LNAQNSVLEKFMNSIAHVKVNYRLSFIVLWRTYVHENFCKLTEFLP